jgi:hypothetical protein
MKSPIPCVGIDRVVFAVDELYPNGGRKADLGRGLARFVGGEEVRRLDKTPKALAIFEYVVSVPRREQMRIPLL